MRDRFVGRTDVPLDPEGPDQARALVSFLVRLRPNRCLASPLTRARATARVLAEPIGLEVETDPDLCEADFGMWEGKTLREVQALDPAGAEQWEKISGDFSFPGGESLERFCARVRGVAERLTARPSGVVLAVTHGGVIRALLCHFLGLGVEHFRRFHVPYASLTTLTVFEGRGVLAGLNLTAAELPAREPRSHGAEAG
jgi:broad specificity phosphatase PhoE